MGLNSLLHSLLEIFKVAIKAGGLGLELVDVDKGVVSKSVADLFGIVGNLEDLVGGLLPLGLLLLEPAFEVLNELSLLLGLLVDEVDLLFNALKPLVEGGLKFPALHAVDSGLGNLLALVDERGGGVGGGLVVLHLPVEVLEVRLELAGVVARLL